MGGERGREGRKVSGEEKGREGGRQGGKADRWEGKEGRCMGRKGWGDG